MVKKLVKPADKPVVTRKEANRVREVATDARKSGKPFDMVRAQKAEELLDRCTIIDEN